MHFSGTMSYSAHSFDILVNKLYSTFRVAFLIWYIYFLQLQRLRTDLIVCVISGVFVFAVSVSTAFTSPVLQVRGTSLSTANTRVVYVVRDQCETMHVTMI